MVRFDVDLTSTLYADAVAVIVQERQAAVDGSWLVSIDDAMTRWQFRGVVAFILVALAVISMLRFGVFSVGSVLAVVAVPVGMVAWLGIERWYGRLDRRIDDAMTSRGAADFAKAIDAGRLAVPLGPVRIEVDDEGVRIRPAGDGPGAAIQWSAVREVVRFGEGVLLLPRRLRSRQDMLSGILVPLQGLDEGERAAVEVLLAERVGVPKETGRA